MAISGKSEGFQWILILLSTAKDIIDAARGVNDAIPKEWKDYFLKINSKGKGKNDEVVFMEVVLNSGLEINEIDSVEKFMENLDLIDEKEKTHKLRDFILFVAKGASEITKVKTESGAGTNKKVSEKEERSKGKVVGFVRRIASKSSFDEQMKICDLYRIWEDGSSPIGEKVKGFFSNLAPTDDQMAELERKYEESKKNKKSGRTI